MKVALTRFALVLTIAAFCLALPSAFALTASIGNARMIIHTDASPENPAVIQKSIKVNNVNDIPVQITIRDQGDIAEYTEILDKAFTLQPKDSFDARFVMTLEYGGTYEGKILVDFSAAELGTKATPVGLASTVIVISSGPPNPNPPTGSTDVTEEDTAYVDNPEDNADLPNSEDSPIAEDNSAKEPARPALDGMSKAPVKKKASPLVGMLIIGIVLVIGIVVYMWYMRN